MSKFETVWFARVCVRGLFRDSRWGPTSRVVACHVEQRVVETRTEPQMWAYACAGEEKEESTKSKTGNQFQHRHVK